MPLTPKDIFLLELKILRSEERVSKLENELKELQSRELKSWKTGFINCLCLLAVMTVPLFMISLFSNVIDVILK